MLRILDDLRHVADSSLAEMRPGLPQNRRSGVQFHIEKQGKGAILVTYNVLGAPTLVALAEYLARYLTDSGGVLPDTEASRQALGLTRADLGSILNAEDAWRLAWQDGKENT